MLYLSIFGIFLSVIIFVFNGKKYRSAMYLAGFFFLSSLYGLNIYILNYSGSALLVSIVLMYGSFSIFFNGPMLYLYIRSTLTDNPYLRRSDAWHVVPAAIVFLLSLPYIFAPLDEKFRIASEIVKNIDIIGWNKFPIMYPLIPAQIVVLSGAVQVYAYTFISIWIFASYLKSGKKNDVLSGQQVMTKWLAVFLGFLFILVVSDSTLQIEIIFTKDPMLYNTINLLRIFSTISLTGVMISPLFFPSILYGLPRIPAVRVHPVVLKEPDPPGQKNDHKSKALVLENEYLRQIERSIESVFRDSEPYLQQDFNLAKLSVLTGIPLHHLESFFREYMKLSFHDYRNKWRVNYAKMLIREGKAVELTLEAVGLMAGFSSRNTFFVAFKRFEGIAPGEFAKGQTSTN